MPYLESVAASPVDFLDELFTFAKTYAGFTEHSSFVVTGFQAPIRVLSRNGMYWWFGILNSATDTEYGTYGNMSFRMMTTQPTSSANYLTTANGQKYPTLMSLFNRPIGPYISHRFYTDLTGKAVHAVLEIAPLVFSHLSFGELTKFFNWTGGHYIVASHVQIGTGFTAAGGWPNYYENDWVALTGTIPFYAILGQVGNTAIGAAGYIYNPVRSLGNELDFAPISNYGPSTTYGYQKASFSGYPGQEGQTLSYSSMYVNLHDISSNDTWNNRAILMPSRMIMYDSRIAAAGRNSFLAGHIPDVCTVNMRNINPKETVDVSWDVFPGVQKDGDHFSYPVTGLMGIAYNRIN